MTTTKIDCNKFKLQYITNASPKYSCLEGAKLALAGGCRWIQLRMKNTEHATLTATAIQLKQLCNQYSAILIINDNVMVAKEIKAHGVHLGKNDMPIKQARAMLTADQIIGATANTLADANNATKAGADYIGIGPFRFTTTKQNLSPILGIKGYNDIISQLPNTQHIPIVAIGGIEVEDVPKLMQTGVSGVAVSSGILHSNNIAQRTAEFLEQLK